MILRYHGCGYEEQAKKEKSLLLCFMLVSCLAYFSTLKMEATFSSEISVYGLYGVFSQKTEHFENFPVVLGHEARH
jgi:hypothetical protein